MNIAKPIAVGVGFTTHIARGKIVAAEAEATAAARDHENVCTDENVNNFLSGLHGGGGGGDNPFASKWIPFSKFSFA